MSRVGPFARIPNQFYILIDEEATVLFLFSMIFLSPLIISDLNNFFSQVGEVLNCYERFG